jgi:ElaB/YqjD/DUF883 family membrane-anchored ribosome-binding protein
VTNEHKITDMAGDVASTAGKLAEQAKDKASELASRAAPLAEQAKDKATDTAHKAGTVAAHGVEATAETVDKLTQRKYSGRIKTFSSKLGNLLHRHDSTQN